MLVYIESRIDGVEDRLSQRMDTSKEAVEMARLQVNERLSDLNHLRAQMRDERGALITREAYELNHRNLETRLDQTRDRIIALEKIAANYEGRMWMLVAVMGALFTLLQVLMKIFWTK